MLIKYPGLTFKNVLQTHRLQSSRFSLTKLSIFKKKVYNLCSNSIAKQKNISEKNTKGGKTLKQHSYPRVNANAYPQSSKIDGGRTFDDLSIADLPTLDQLKSGDRKKNPKIIWRFCKKYGDFLNQLEKFLQTPKPILCLFIH